MATADLLPEFDPDRLHWRYVDGRPIQLLLPEPVGRRAADAARLYAAVAEEHLAPLIAALRRTVPISERLLWGNAASALAGACRVVGPELSQEVLRIAQDLLRRGRLRGTGTLAPGPPPAFTRNSCCLYYRVPGGGTCGDCVLNGRTVAGT